jgi:hypothetical protein
MVEGEGQPEGVAEESKPSMDHGHSQVRKGGLQKRQRQDDKKELGVSTGARYRLAFLIISESLLGVCLWFALVITVLLSDSSVCTCDYGFAFPTDQLHSFV